MERQIEQPSRDPAGAAQRFAATRWSLVAAARRGDAGTPLTELCVRYWYPVYAYMRRCGHVPASAQQVTLAFFDHLVRDRLPQVDPAAHGRFRTFVLAEVSRFLGEVWRGEPVTDPAYGLVEPLATDLLEARYQAETPTMATPDQAFQ